MVSSSRNWFLLRKPISRNKEEIDYEVSTDSEEETRKASRKRLRASIVGIVIDVLIAFMIMAAVLGVMYVYTQKWPPMVVVESDSMMHGRDSSIDVIDTGDLVLVKKITRKDDLVTYVAGKARDYKTYGDYGDVIIYNKNGGAETPVIHRIVCWAEYDEEKGTFDIPEFTNYNLAGPAFNLGIETPSTYIEDYGHKKVNLTLKFDKILDNFRNFNKVPHSGFITKGDKNDKIDQVSLHERRIYPNSPLVEPVKMKWVVGKAEAELPWFGLIKLYITGGLKEAPASSVTFLIVFLILLIALPIVMDFLLVFISRHRRKARAHTEEDDVTASKKSANVEVEVEAEVHTPNNATKPPPTVSKSELEAKLKGNK